MSKSVKGSISIHTENIFPIIKKWLYSDHDIFVRELISNSFDAINKLKKVSISNRRVGWAHSELARYIEAKTLYGS